jgi:A/G-specific adenine glycosylase
MSPSRRARDGEPSPPADDLPRLHPRTIASIRRRLLDHYRSHRRDLPWRRERDPYRIWISEVMLQQTRVETAVPYYQRFLREFPDVRALASAGTERVLRAWAGLGYYGRARRLHAAAREVTERYGGTFPSTQEDIRSLPGIGEYTAAAVGSIAFGLPLASVDGNAVRVLSRLFLLEGSPAALRRRAAAAARDLLPPEEAGDFNQALMELGATICRPRNPECGRCPVRRSCRARRRGLTDRYPPRRAGTPLSDESHVAALLGRPGGILLVRRPDASLLGGFWELPTLVLSGPPGRPETLRRRLGEHLRSAYGLRVRLGAPLAGVRHGILNRRIHGVAVPGRLAGDAGGPLRRFGIGRLDPLPLTTLSRKLLRASGILPGD